MNILQSKVFEEGADVLCWVSPKSLQYGIGCDYLRLCIRDMSIETVIPLS